MIGEIRNKETAEAALKAAETGHLVFSTLHTPNVKETAIRYVDIFPDEVRNVIRTQFGLTLLGIFCQRLLPKKTGRVE